MGTTNRVISGSKTKGSIVTHTSSIRPFRQGINASSDEDYFGTSLIPRVGAGPRFALYRGNNRISDLNFDDTIRTADIPAKLKVSFCTASISFSGVPSVSPYEFDKTVGTTEDAFITLRSADGREGKFFPGTSNTTPRKSRPTRTSSGAVISNDYWQCAFAVTGTPADIARQFGKQVNALFEGRIQAMLGDTTPKASPGMTWPDITGSLERPFALNKTVFLTQTIGGPLGKQSIKWQNMTHVSVNGSSAATSITTASLLYKSLFGTVEEVDVSFLGMSPVQQRINFQRKEVNFGQPPTSPEKQPFHAVNTFNPVSFIEADERSMWPVNLFNAGNLPHRVFDGVIEPLDIRSVLLQMHDPRFEGHGVRAELQGASSAGILGSREIQDSKIKGDPPAPPFLDSPMGFNAGASDIAKGIDFTGNIPGQTITLATPPSTKLAMQPYSSIDIEQSNPFFERSAQEVITDIQNFNNSIEISRTKAKAGFKAFASLSFANSNFVECTNPGNIQRLDDTGILILTSSDNTIRIYTGSTAALTTEFPPATGSSGDPINGVVPYFVDEPTESFALISQGTGIPVSATPTTDYTIFRNHGQPITASRYPFPAGQSTWASNPNNLLLLQPRITFDSSTSPAGFAQEEGYGIDVANFAKDNAGWYAWVPTRWLTTPAQVSRRIVDAINNPIRKLWRGSAWAELYSTGSFTGIKIHAGVPGDQTPGSPSHGTGPLNGTNDWQLTDWKAGGWLPQSSGSSATGTRGWAFISFNEYAVPVHGDSFTITTPSTRASAISSAATYFSSSTFTFDHTVTPKQSGLGAHKYIIGLDSGSLVAGANWANTDRSVIAAISTTLSVYNTIGNPISGTVGVYHNGSSTEDSLFLTQLWHAPRGNTVATANYADPQQRNWTIRGFEGAAISERTRKNSQRALIAAITGAYGHGSKIIVNRKNTVGFPETTIILTQASSSAAFPAGDTVISSSIEGTVVSPGAGERPVTSDSTFRGGKQFGIFSGPPEARANIMTRELGKMNFLDMGDLDVRQQNSNHGFYFDKKAGSIVYGDES